MFELDLKDFLGYPIWLIDLLILANFNRMKTYYFALVKIWKTTISIEKESNLSKMYTWYVWRRIFKVIARQSPNLCFFMIFCKIFKRKLVQKPGRTRKEIRTVLSSFVSKKYKKICHRLRRPSKKGYFLKKVQKRAKKSIFNFD